MKSKVEYRTFDPSQDACGCILRAAQEYSRNGLKIFPLQPHTNKPAFTGECQSATSDFYQIEQWWTEMPNANIGLPLAENHLCCVLLANNQDVDESLKVLSSAGLKFPLTNSFRCIKGRKYIYRITDKNPPCIIALDIPVFQKEWIAIPPSVNPPSRGLQWEDWHRTTFATCPNWFFELEELGIGVSDLDDILYERPV